VSAKIERPNTPSPAPSATGRTRFDVELVEAPDVVLDAAAAADVVVDPKVRVVKDTAVAMDVLVIEVVDVESPGSRAV